MLMWVLEVGETNPMYYVLGRFMELWVRSLGWEVSGPSPPSQWRGPGSSGPSPGGGVPGQ